jgi:hypothetical protein
MASRHATDTRNHIRAFMEASLLSGDPIAHWQK